jgi:SAM-dependent methyltransferase
VTTYFEYYGDLHLQRFMVSDERRTDAFARAIQEVVRPNDRVLDVGTGTGVLAMLAAKAGASYVHAIDQANIVDTARKLVAHNGLENRVTVHAGNANELKLDEPVDLIISEWLGQMAFEENMLRDVIVARDNNLKPNGAMLPCGVDVQLAPIDDSELYHRWGPGYWRKPVHGLDFSPLEALEVGQARAQRTLVPASALLSPGGSLVNLDLKQAKTSDPWQRGTLEFTIERDAVCHGFVGWFIAHLSPSVSLDTGPHCAETHWSQTFFPFTPVEVKKGQKLVVDYELAPIDYSPRGIEVVLRTEHETHYFALD